jgi:hypothetical protein
MLVATHAPARHATEAFTWQMTSIVSGVGAGMAVGGWLVDVQGPAATFLLAAGSALTGALLASRLRHGPPPTIALAADASAVDTAKAPSTIVANDDSSRHRSGEPSLTRTRE